MNRIYILILSLLIAALADIGCSSNKNNSGQSANGGIIQGQVGKGGAAAGQAGDASVGGSQTGNTGGMTSTNGLAGSSGANDGGTPYSDAPNVVYQPRNFRCNPTSFGNGQINGIGRAWVVKNIGSSGTINITVSVTGDPDAGISGVPTVNKQFTFLAGTVYTLVVGLPVKTERACPSSMPSSVPCMIPGHGPFVRVTVPGIPIDTFTFSFAEEYRGVTTYAKGEPVIALEEGDWYEKTVPDGGGAWNCPPFPDGG